MGPFFEIEHIGKYDISSYCSTCAQCRRLTVLNSYSTTRFIKILGLPFLPVARRHMFDECSYCGHRGMTSARKYMKDRKRNLALMMDGFASKPDNPDTCAHGLRTLMVYNEKAWFDNVQKSYGRRFDTHMQIQFIIAEGLCRFGEYDHAIEHCRKAIVLGGGKPAEELLSFCQRLLESTEGGNDFDALRFQPESVRKAYIPLATIAATLTLAGMLQGITALRTNAAWLVNGSLQKYTFLLDKNTYTLPPGRQMKIKLMLGKHTLQMKSQPPVEFNYSTSLFKQLLQKQLLVINPDAMAILTIEEKRGTGTLHAYGQQVHKLSGVGYPLFGLRQQEDVAPVGNSIGIYRQKTHMGAVDHLNKLGLADAARDYAQKALAMDPATHEVVPLLKNALHGVDEKTVATFLQPRLSIQPALLPWHLYYQDHVMGNQATNSLVKEYTEWCKNHPDEPEGYYLLARVMKNPEDAYSLFLFSEKGRGMGGLGYHAIALDLFGRGSFEQALAFSSKATQKNPDDERFSLLHEQILLALRRYDELLELKDELGEEEEVLYLTCTGYHREAEAAAIRYGGGDAQHLSALNAIRYYAVGNMPEYLQCLEDADNPAATFLRHLHENRIAQADHVLLADENHPWPEHLVLYCAAMAQQEKALADIHLAKARAEMDCSSLQESKLARLLETEQAPDPEQIHSLQIGAPEKALLCTALGFRFPEQRPAFHAIARNFNFNPVHPQILLKKWTQPKINQPMADSADK